METKIQQTRAKKLYHKFNEEEDLRLKNLVNIFGPKKWKRIATMMPGRTARQCRDRYSNYLTPGYIQNEWTPIEDDLLFEKFKEYGSQWSKIREFFPRRTANSIKNRWNYSVSRRLTQKNEYQQYFNASNLTPLDSQESQEHLFSSDNEEQFLDDSFLSFAEFNNEPIFDDFPYNSF